MTVNSDTRSLWRRRLARAAMWAVLIIWTIIVYFPLYWVFTTSFKQPVAVTQATFLPWVHFEPTLQTWQDVLAGQYSQDVFESYGNSLIAGAGSAFLATILGAMAGYGLARYTYKFTFMRNNDIAFWFISQRMLPPVAVVLAYLLLYRDLNLLDTHFGLTLAYVGFNLPLVVWIMRDFFQQIPLEIEESAEIDGASRWRIFWRIAMPLAVPGLVASFLLSLILSLNEYLFAVILTARYSKTFPIMLASQFTGDSFRVWVLSALALMNLIPMALVAIVLERYLVRGLFAGAVKQ